MHTHDLYDRALLDRLPASTSGLLLSIYRDGQEVGDGDVEALARLTGLERLSLHGAKRLTDAGLARLAAVAPRLRHLSLSGAGITAAGLKHLAALPELGHVSLSSLEGVRGLSALSVLPLTRIEVRACKGLDLATLSESTGLTAVNIVSQGVTAAHVAALARLSALESLEIHGYNVSIAPGLEAALAGMGALTSLHLARPLSDAEVAALVGLEALQTACLVVTDAADLDRLSPLSGRVRVRLRFTDIERITDDLLARIPEVLPDLDGLDLDQGQVVRRGQKFGARGLSAIGKLADLRFLNLYRGGDFKNDAVAPLGALKKLEGLNLQGCHKLTSGVVSTLASMTALRRLNVSGIKVSDSSLKKLAALPLEALYVHDTKLTDKALINLSGCTTLRRLNAEFGNIHFGDAGLQALASLTALEEVNLAVGAVSPAAFATLARLPALRHVRLEGDLNSTRITDAHLTALSASTSLESLSLGMYVRQSITDEGLLAMARIPSLTALRLQGSGAAAAALRDAGVMFESSTSSTFESYVSSGLWSSAR